MSKKNFKTSFDSFLLGEESQRPPTKVKDKEIRATFIVNIDHIEKLKAISFWEKKMLKEVLNEALTQYLTEYEKNKGYIQLPK